MTVLDIETWDMNQYNYRIGPLHIRTGTSIAIHSRPKSRVRNGNYNHSPLKLQVITISAFSPFMCPNSASRFDLQDQPVSRTGLRPTIGVTVSGPTAIASGLTGAGFDGFFAFLSRKPESCESAEAKLITTTFPLHMSFDNYLLPCG